MPNTLTMVRIAVAAREEILSVRDKCQRRGIARGTHTRKVALAWFWKDQCMRFPGCGSDIGYLWVKAAETARAVLDPS
jgi:hypothetical protein